MTLEAQINNDIKAAMLAKDKVRLTSIRAIKAAILLAKTSAGGTGVEGELPDAQVLSIIQKLVKQRKETADVYTQNGRPELAQNELDEMAFMEPYLPKALTESEVEDILRKIIAEVGATGMAQMGKVMGVATKQLAGQADGRVISALVKKLLG